MSSSRFPWINNLLCALASVVVVREWINDVRKDETMWNLSQPSNQINLYYIFVCCVFSLTLSSFLRGDEERTCSLRPTGIWNSIRISTKKTTLTEPTTMDFFSQDFCHSWLSWTIHCARQRCNWEIYIQSSFISRGDCVSRVKKEKDFNDNSSSSTIHHHNSAFADKDLSVIIVVSFVPTVTSSLLP